jgi:peptidyl-prolyl cis-trans isomerase C
MGLIPLIILLVSSSVLPGSAQEATGQTPARSPQADLENTETAVPGAFPEIVALVNSEPIHKQELMTRVQAVRTSMRLPVGSLPIGFYRNVLNDLIGIELLFQASRDRELEVTSEEVEQQYQDLRSQFPTEEAFREQLGAESTSAGKLRQTLRKDMSVQKYIESELASGIVIGDTEKKNFFEENQKLMQKPEQLRISHILALVGEGSTPAQRTAAREKIEGLRRQLLEEGADFAALAREHSEDPTSKDSGGEMVIARGQTVAPFEKAAFALQPGEISSIVETEYGYHIIRLTERMPAQQLSYEQVEDRIREFLIQQRVRDAVQSEVKNLRAKAAVELFI